jgi:hypothetical protein
MEEATKCVLPGAAVAADARKQYDQKFDGFHVSPRPMRESLGAIK